MRAIRKYLWERVLSLVKIAIFLVTEAVLFVIWLGVECGLQAIEDFAHDHGFQSWAPAAFHWMSSAALLIIVFVIVTRDVVKEFREGFWKSEGKK